MLLHYKLSPMVPITIIAMLLLISWKVYGYAEIHYTFFRYSIINRGYPEILIDMPWRVDPGQLIPVVCIVKDADKFPVKLKKITARYKTEQGEMGEKALLEESCSLRVEDHYWYMLSFIEPPEMQTGKFIISVEIEAVKNGFKKIIMSDNYPGLSHAPFEVFVSPWEMPSFDGWHYGDAHYHTDVTQDQVEFGAPVEVASTMGKSMGLSWLVASDHSYDLDIALGEFFRRDPKLTRWHKMREDTQAVNSRNNDFFVIPAEEVSCGNCKFHNIHLLAFDTPYFIPGKGDGVKRGLNKRPDLSLRKCLNRINDTGGFAYAAHPEEGNGFLGTLMLNRDHWRDRDYAQGGYSGMQFWNGNEDKAFSKAYEKWIQLLLEGRRLFILGGNDSHGDFNRCRKVKYPNTRLSEEYDHIFGKTRTYAYCQNGLSVSAILDALRNGRTVVTNGTLAVFQVYNSAGQEAGIGDDITGQEFSLTINVRSSEEFGSINEINLYRGDLVTKIEQIEKTFKANITDTNVYDCVFVHNTTHKNRGYFRIEATSSAKGKRYRCFTNPIWTRSV